MSPDYTAHRLQTRQGRFLSAAALCCPAIISAVQVSLSLGAVTESKQIRLCPFKSAQNFSIFSSMLHTPYAHISDGMTTPDACEVADQPLPREWAGRSARWAEGRQGACSRAAGSVSCQRR